MPNFPKYRGYLPETLNPLNPRHYFLLAYWIFFRPTAFHCYLYQASPECYQLRGISKIRRTWGISAYRNLYLMAPVAVLLLVLSLVTFAGFYLLWSLQSHTDLTRTVVTPDGQQVVSVSLDKTLKVWELKSGKLLHTLSGHTDSVCAIAVTPDGQQVVSASLDKTLKVWELKSGKLLHTLSGHTDSVRAIAVTPDGQQVVSASLDKTLKVWELKSGKLLHTLSFHNGSVFAIAVVPEGQQVVSTSDDKTLTISELNKRTAVPLQKLSVPSFAIAILLGLVVIDLLLVFPVLTAISLSLDETVFFLGFFVCFIISSFFFRTFGIPMSLVAHTVNLKILSTPLFNDAYEFICAYVFCFGIAYSIILCKVFLRFIFYPIELLLALYSRQFQSWQHPLEWDEVIILPLPGTQRLLSQHLQLNQVVGLDLMSKVARQPFQRSAAQKTLKTYLHTQAAPLHLLYKLLTHPDLNTYVVVPISEEGWKQLPSIGHQSLGELTGQWVNFSTNWFDRVSERLIWKIAHWRRNSHQTPLTLFAGMLYQLLDDEKVNAEDFNLFSYSSIYTRLTDYPNGIEIERSFEAMASFLSYKELSALPTAIDFISKLPPQETAIRPNVMNALSQLGDIGAEIATYQIATSRVNQLAAIARATDNLDVLDEYVNTDLVVPEQTIIQRIIRQWRKLVSEAGGQVGREEDLAPVENPYVAGNPVIGSLFVGRKDILRELEELWIQPEQCSSVVLYGHRRMGKSSILKNLSNRFGSQTIIVDFNMQRVGIVDNTSELMYSLALAIYDSLPAAEQVELGEPDEERFTNHNPFTVFDRFLKQVEHLQMQKRLIVTIDEFELIEKLINSKRLQPQLLDFLRGMIQTYPWFVMAFAGLYTLQDMTEDYWNPLFGSVKALKVSFLSPAAARKLITQPHPDFDLDYDEAAIGQIIQLTNGQPYLIQLICQNLITRYNRQMFEENISRDRRFTREDVEAIVSTSEFFRDGDAYFKGVWNQADSSPVGQTDILKVLCGQDVSSFSVKMSLAEIISQTNLSLGEVKAALITLENHDVIIQNNQQYTYTVELMRRWVAKTQKDQL